MILTQRAFFATKKTETVKKTTTPRTKKATATQAQKVEKVAEVEAVQKHVEEAVADVTEAVVKPVAAKKRTSKTAAVVKEEEEAATEVASETEVTEPAPKKRITKAKPAAPAEEVTSENEAVEEVTSETEAAEAKPAPKKRATTKTTPKKEEDVVVSKLFGKITKRPTKKQFAEELLEGDMTNMGRVVTGDEKNKGDIKLREMHLARMIADYKKICYTDAQLTKVRTKMEKTGETEHVLFGIPDKMQSAWKRKRSVLYFVNVPAMIAIPAFLELADLSTKYGDKADLVMGLFTCIDIFVVAQSYMLYHFMQKLVCEVKYDSVEDKIKITQPHGSMFLGNLESEYTPKELEKKMKMSGVKTSFNKSLGYRSIKKGENLREFGTEFEGAMWSDRQFMDTIISQPGERFKGHKRMQKWQGSKKKQTLA